MKIPIEITRGDYGVEEFCVTDWYKKLGDDVQKGEIICQVDLGKGVYDIEASQSGKLAEILAEAQEWRSFDQGLLKAVIGYLEVD